VRRKIPAARDAVRGAGGNNGRMELTADGKNLVEATQRLFSGRDASR
jgi:hypothetical protein